jgi:hypothetical protein
VNDVPDESFDPGRRRKKPVVVRKRTVASGSVAKQTLRDAGCAGSFTLSPVLSALATTKATVVATAAIDVALARWRHDSVYSADVAVPTFRKGEESTRVC